MTVLALCLLSVALAGCLARIVSVSRQRDIAEARAAELEKTVAAYDDEMNDVAREVYGDSYLDPDLGDK